MRTVAIESPFAGDVAFNLRYLDLCILDCIRRGETPYASHRMLVTALDDMLPRERDLGIRAGMAMSRTMDLRAFYMDLGMSSGMQRARTAYDRDGLAIEERSLSALYGDVPSAIHEMRGLTSEAKTTDKLAFYEQEVKRLRKWIDDLHAGMYINCVYCGHRYGPSDEVPVSMATVLKAHIETCPEHPMSALKKELEETKRELERVQGELGYHGLK